MAEKNRATGITPPPSRPTITLPPRSSVENLFTGGGAGASPGPMTLVANFFSDNDPANDCRSFSQLLAGAMASPVSVTGWRPNFFPVEEDSSNARFYEDGSEKDSRIKQSHPLSLMIAQSPMFTIPPGLSPTSLLDSPRFFLPGQGTFGISHQQALAQVTAQAAQSQSLMHSQAEYPTSLSAHPGASLALHQTFTSNATATQLMQPLASNPKGVAEFSEPSHSDLRSQPLPLVVDKPADDGYNWRKYGQKQVKGSEYPRSYYKCTHINCPVKKKVERSIDGHVTEIIYKGKHNHQKPSNKRSKEGGNSDGNVNFPGHSEGHTGNLSKSTEIAVGPSLSRKDQESLQATPEQLSGLSEDEEVGDGAEMRVDEGDDDEPDPKRPNTGIRVSEPSASHRTVTEPRIIVQTTSEVDLLDDGFRWRKYGQKVVKGNPHPRSYYKCTTAGCNVRKHVERASTDPKAVITTYEGKHNHDVPAAKNSSHNTANSYGQLKPQYALAEQLKEEQTT
ncbi:DNA-binding WRKY [Macleaya cordata]|uniref:DNA-binding WRKY n=1 Tax=Macleaya cordata TaxID=56857 RepID=A0A200QEE0_MACCD|nr:DNA-binding WRKY [Macleaya cordata]